MVLKVVAPDYCIGRRQELISQRISASIYGLFAQPIEFQTNILSFERLNISITIKSLKIRWIEPS